MKGVLSFYAFDFNLSQFSYVRALRKKNRIKRAINKVSVEKLTTQKNIF